MLDICVPIPRDRRSQSAEEFGLVGSRKIRQIAAGVRFAQQPSAISVSPPPANATVSEPERFFRRPIAAPTASHRAGKL